MAGQMKPLETLRVERDEDVVRVTLNRPDVRNAFNATLIAEMTQVFSGFGADVRAVILTGEGPVFCAGADVQWMKQSIGYTAEENARDATALATMLQAIDRAVPPVIAQVHGAALGGGMGLIAACDLVLAAEDTQFGFTEVRLGIVPAVISSFVLRKTGAAPARRYFLTGEIFAPAAAQAMGLVHEIVPLTALPARVLEHVATLRKCGPQAVATAKALIREIQPMAYDQAIEHAVKTIARVRTSPEGQEGLGAFLEKRKPRWME
jgi:methylglutaconyl-CoA hydratase